MREFYFKAVNGEKNTFLLETVKTRLLLSLSSPELGHFRPAKIENRTSTTFFHLAKLVLVFFVLLFSAFTESADAQSCPDPADDKQVLLDSLVTLDPNSTLNWSASTEILMDWEGEFTLNVDNRIFTLRIENNPSNIDLEGGALPAEFGCLDDLSNLTLSGTKLTGTILSEFGNLRFGELHLNDNRLTGTIPSELANLRILAELHLHGNQLTGTIPSELGSESTGNLRELYLHGNQLSGTIPPKLGNFEIIQELKLNDNRLSGTIPPELGSLGILSSFTELYLNDNRLSGTIPPELGNLTNVAELHLNDNRLNGTIPTQFESLEGLVQLNLSNNQLSGTIPDLAGLPKLDKLDFSYNVQLTGELRQNWTDSALTELNIKCTGLTTNDTDFDNIDITETGMSDICPPDQVTGVSVTPGLRMLTVSWDPVTDADGYEVQWRSGRQSFYSDSSRERVVDGATTTDTIPGLAGGVRYKVIVIATRTDTTDDGPQSLEVSGTPLSPPAPPREIEQQPVPPALDQVSGVSVSAGVEQLEVSWTEVSGADGYKVRWKSGTQIFDSSRERMVMGGTTTTDTIPGLVAGTEYGVIVIATRANDPDGPESSEVSGIPLPLPLMSRSGGGCTMVSQGAIDNTSQRTLLNLFLIVSTLFLVAGRAKING